MAPRKKKTVNQVLDNPKYKEIITEWDSLLIAMNFVIDVSQNKDKKQVEYAVNALKQSLDRYHAALINVEKMLKND